MPRKQVIVQLDDDLVADLDALATRLGVNRSELLRRGSRMILDAAQTLVWEEEHRRGYAQLPEDLTWQDDYARATAAEAPIEYGTAKRDETR